MFLDNKSSAFNSFENCSKTFFLSLMTVFLLSLLPLCVILEQFKHFNVEILLKFLKQQQVHLFSQSE